MDKYLLFTTGDGSADPLNLNSDKSTVYSVSDFKGMKPADARSIDLFFDTNYGKEIVTLGVKNGTHSEVMRSISNAVVSGNQSIISIADVDSNRFVNTNIHSAEIKTQELHCQKITAATATTKTKITLGRRNYSSCLITNTTTVNVRVSLYLASQLGTDIEASTTAVNYVSGYAATTSSQAIVIDTLTTDLAASNKFLDERVYLSDGTFVGTCTAVGGPTSITFGGGLEVALVDDYDLYIGARYHLTNELKIPRQDTLKLEANEISFDNSKFALYAASNRDDGHLTFVFHY